MKINSTGLHIIKSFEGFRATPYLCPAGLPTIGYGHVIRPGEHFTELTEPMAFALLIKDVAIFEKGVAKLIKVPLTSNQFSALVSFAFNLGLNALQRSTLRMRLNAGEYQNAADQFLRWDKIGTKRVKGLTNRRTAERALFLAEDYAFGGE